MRTLFAVRDEKELPDFAVEWRDTLRRDDLLFQKLMVRSGSFLPLPGVLQRYDVPDLARALGRRLVVEAK